MKTVMFEMEPWESEAVSAFIYSDLGRAVLEKLPKLKLVATRSTGFDHIATDYAAERDIVVCNVPAYGDNTVAELDTSLDEGLAGDTARLCLREHGGH